jgi:ubiquinone biosynthesis monooxygenase Coq7
MVPADRLRHDSPLDRLLAGVGRALATVAAAPGASRPMPRPEPPRGAAPAAPGEPLDPAGRRLSGALMRVNHVGEVCAQALYEAQAAVADDPRVAQFFREAAAEEGDHLAWTRERLAALGARPSLLNPLWYAGAFAIGAAAGRLGTRFSLGFMVETERQVERHLEGHLARLPAADAASRAIVERMRAEEAGHADQAEAMGALPMPPPVRAAMRLSARVMTRTAHWV